MKDFIVYPTNTTLEVYDRGKGRLVRPKSLSYSIRSDAVSSSKTFVFLGADFVGGGLLVKVDVTNAYLDHEWWLMSPSSAVRAAARRSSVKSSSLPGTTATSPPFPSPGAAQAVLWATPNGFFHTYGQVTADLAVDEAGLYVASTDTKLCALNLTTGKSEVAVRIQYLAPPTSPVTTKDKDLVFQFVPRLGYVALDKGAGAFNRVPRWVAPDVIKILAVDEKYVYALREDRAMIALDKKDGHATFTSKRHDIATWTTNTLDGTICMP